MGELRKYTEQAFCIYRIKDIPECQDPSQNRLPNQAYKSISSATDRYRQKGHRTSCFWEQVQTSLLFVQRAQGGRGKGAVLVLPPAHSYDPRRASDLCHYALTRWHDFNTKNWLVSKLEYRKTLKQKDRSMNTVLLYTPRKEIPLINKHLWRKKRGCEGAKNWAFCSEFFRRISTTLKHNKFRTNQELWNRQRSFRKGLIFFWYQLLRTVINKWRGEKCSKQPTKQIKSKKTPKTNLQVITYQNVNE